MEGYRRCNAAAMAGVAESLLLAAHRQIVVLAVVGRKQRSFVD